MDMSPRWLAPRLVCRSSAPERFLIPQVHLFDPESHLDLLGDVLVEEGRIAALGERVEPPAGVEVLDDLAGCWVFPGFVDPHTHLRTPGFEYKEDLASGSLAAAAGGYVAVVAMANTNPVVDCGPVAAWVLQQAAEQAEIRVGQVGSVSKGLRGEELAEIREMADVGVVAFSDDGQPVSHSDLLLHALRYTRATGRPLLLHLEDKALSEEAVMHEGKWSARLGLRGMPAACECGDLARALEIVRYVHGEENRLVRSAGGTGSGSESGSSGAPLVHFQHLSASGSVRLVRAAKQEGLPVTAEVTPLHLLLTDEDLQELDPNLKINPPLRSVEDREALVTALSEGTIDCVGTDHAPHAPHEKEVPFEEALFGSTGLETAFAALYTGLVEPGVLSLRRLVEVMSTAPCRVLGVEAPRLAAGSSADFCVVDLQEKWEVTPESLRGKSRNCAFLGRTLHGRVRLTVTGGSRRFTRNKGEA